VARHGLHAALLVGPVPADVDADVARLAPLEAHEIVALATRLTLAEPAAAVPLPGPLITTASPTVCEPCGGTEVKARPRTYTQTHTQRPDAHPMEASSPTSPSASLPPQPYVRGAPVDCIVP
jgi:hypothetical protein